MDAAVIEAEGRLHGSYLPELQIPSGPSPIRSHYLAGVLHDARRLVGD